MFRKTILPFLLPSSFRLIYLPWACPTNDTYRNQERSVHHGPRRASLEQKHKCIATTVSSNATHISEFVKRNPYPHSLSGTLLFKGRKACVAARLGQLQVVWYYFKGILGKSIEHRGSEACMRITLRMIEKERMVVTSTNCLESRTNERWAFFYCEDRRLYRLRCKYDPRYYNELFSHLIFLVR